MLKSFKYRIYPTNKQKEILNQTLTTCRFLYNNSLSERIEKYKKDKISISYKAQANSLSKNKDDFQKKIHSQVLQSILKRLDKSFKNFFRRIKKREEPGFPRFKSENRFNSFLYPQSGFKLLNKRIHLSKIGKIKLVYHRLLEGKIKTCIVKKEIDQWYVILTSEISKEIPVNTNTKEIGIDLGIKNYLTLSDGKVIDKPKHLSLSEDKLIKQQKILSRRTKRSNNRKKQRITVSKVHRKIKNQRNDFLHKLSSNLIKKYKTIIFENLNIKNMLQNSNLAKDISDCSWAKLIEYSTYKAEWAGGRIILVDPKNTSRVCSKCGWKNEELTLKDRIFKCKICGNKLDRDVNASLNILSKNTVGTTGINACGEDKLQNHEIQ